MVLTTTFKNQGNYDVKIYMVFGSLCCETVVRLFQKQKLETVVRLFQKQKLETGSFCQLGASRVTLNDCCFVAPLKLWAKLVLVFKCSFSICWDNIHTVFLNSFSLDSLFLLKLMLITCSRQLAEDIIPNQTGFL